MCGRWRHIVDFQARDWERGVARVLLSACDVCRRRRNRELQGIRKRGRPYERRKPAMTAEEKRRRKRDAAKRMTPEQREHKRAMDREYKAFQRRQAGVSPRNFSNHVVDDERSYVSLKPFRLWLSRTELSLHLLSARSGVSDRQLRSYREGYTTTTTRTGALQRSPLSTVPVDVVDRVLLAAGVPLSELYP